MLSVIAAIVFSQPFAGLAGAVLSLYFVRDKEWSDQAFAFGIGLGCALYLAPVAAETLQIKSPGSGLAFTFLAGLLGLNILTKAVEVMRSADWISLLTSFLTSIRGNKP